MTEISSTGDQMLQLLERIAFEGPGTTAELAAGLGMNRTVAHRLLATLRARGYVRRDGRRFDLGPTLGRLARLPAADRMVERLRAPMSALARQMNETLVLHQIDGGEAVVVEQLVGPSNLLQVQHRVGARHSLARGAGGRAILAFQPPALVARTLRQSPPPELEAQLAEVRRTGYAVSRNELQDGVVAVAVPLREEDGLVRFSLALLMPIQRADKLPQAIAGLLAFAVP